MAKRGGCQLNRVYVDKPKSAKRHQQATRLLNGTSDHVSTCGEQPTRTL